MNKKKVVVLFLTFVLIAIWFAWAQTNPVYEPIVPLFRKLRAMLDAEVFLLEQRKAVLDAQVTYVTSEPPDSQLLLESGGYMLREDWLAVAALTTARIDELLLALQ